jgi:hypothetical protein
MTYPPIPPYQVASSGVTPIADKVVTITDALGRQLKLRPIDVLYESQLTRMFGAEAATNPAYMMGFVYPAASVCEIDGVPCPRPASQKEIDDAIQRLGREGIVAFMQHLQSELGQDERLSQKESATTSR